MKSQYVYLRPTVPETGRHKGECRRILPREFIFDKALGKFVYCAAHGCCNAVYHKYPQMFICFLHLWAKMWLPCPIVLAVLAAKKSNIMEKLKKCTEELDGCEPLN